MPTVRYTFDEVAERRTVEIECAVCDEPRKRTLKAFQTENPYNRNPDGTIKSRADIRKELPAALDKMERDLRTKGIICKPCLECGALRCRRCDIALPDRAAAEGCEDRDCPMHTQPDRPHQASPSP